MIEYPFSWFLPVIAMALGSFAATAIIRDLKREEWVIRRSHCPQCETDLKPWHLVPILSFALQLGRCRFCRREISIIYPTVEISFAVIALWSVAQDRHPYLDALVLGWLLVVLAAYDFVALKLPNGIVFLLLIFGLLFGAREGVDGILKACFGIVAGGGVLFAVAFLFEAVRGKKGLGMGDVKLFAAAGTWVGIEGLPQTLFLGCLLALSYGLVTVRRSEYSHSKIPFGPFLCAGLWLTWSYGPGLLEV